LHMSSDDSDTAVGLVSSHARLSLAVPSIAHFPPLPSWQRPAIPLVSLQVRVAPALLSPQSSDSSNSAVHCHCRSSVDCDTAVGVVSSHARLPFVVPQLSCPPSLQRRDPLASLQVRVAPSITSYQNKKFTFVRKV
jgi:hypothetical protein